MKFPDPFTRVRAAQVPDPYNPSSPGEDWTAASRVDLAGWFDSTVSTDQVDPVRSETLTTTQLFLPTSADVQRGDRVEFQGDTWKVTGFPPAPKNPFTGWQPYRVAALQLVVG
jgi:hypothetical protein